MNKKIAPMLGLAVVFGGISIFVADGLMKTKAEAVPVAPVAQVAAQPAVEFKKIVVANQPLRYGAELTADMLSEIDWPAAALPQGAFSSVSELLGSGRRLILSPVEANEPVLTAKISGVDGRATLANLLEPGKRAVTIRVDDISGVAGFVTPGDRVDVVLTRQQNGVAQPANELQPSQPQPGEFASEVILEDIKVLTSDQNLDERAVKAEIARSVTIEVSTAQAQKVALAQQIGTLYLLLRAAGDQADGGSQPFTMSDMNGTKSAPVKADAQAEPDAPVVSLPASGPTFRTLTVTRGHTAENYSVVEEKTSTQANQ